MLQGKLEYLDINKILASYKEDKTKTVEDTQQIIQTILDNGLDFKGNHIKVVFDERINGALKRMQKWYYFICPKCERRTIKLFILKDTLGCGECLKLKRKFRIRYPKDRILKIQYFLNEIYGGGISQKRKNKLIDWVIYHYNKLDDNYKLAHNTILFNKLQEWCLEKVISKEVSKEYKKAMGDILRILRDSNKIMLGTNTILKKKS